MLCTFGVYVHCVRVFTQVPYDVALLTKYRSALDKAVKIATVHNVKPIKGQTMIFVNLGPNMNKPCSSAKGLGSCWRLF